MDLNVALSLIGMSPSELIGNDGLRVAKSRFKAKIKRVHPDVNSAADGGELTMSLIHAMRVIEKHSRPIRQSESPPRRATRTLHQFRVVGRLQAVMKRLASIILIYTERLAKNQTSKAHHKLTDWRECDAMRRQLDHFLYYLRNQVPREELGTVRTPLLGFLSQLSRVLTAVRYSQLSQEPRHRPEGAMVKMVMLDTLLLLRNWAAACRDKPWEAADSFGTVRSCERLMRNLNRLQTTCVTFAWNQAAMAAEEGLRRWLDLLKGLVSFREGVSMRPPSRPAHWRHAV